MVVPTTQSRRQPAPVDESGSDFERKAHASEAVEAGRLPSSWHRRFVWGLGLVCLLLWAALLLVILDDGSGSFLLPPAVMAVGNTVLFIEFLMRMREADRAHAEVGLSGTDAGKCRFSLDRHGGRSATPQMLHGPASSLPDGGSPDGRAGDVLSGS